MPETIGQRLKKAREYRNLTLEKAANATRIRTVYLRALEADDFSAMPSPVQARGFLRNYAEYLGFDLDKLVEEIRLSNPKPDAEQEVVFEGEEQPILPASEAVEVVTLDETDTTEPLWQSWLRRVRQEAGQTVDEPASKPDHEPVSISNETSVVDVEPAPAMETPQSGEAASDVDIDANEDTPETEGRPRLWKSLLSRANIRISQEPVETISEAEDGEELEPEFTPLPSDKDARSSQEIINDIGLQLRQRREMLSLTLEEIERHTRMRAQFLESLESGKFDELPSPVQTRGMLSNYGNFLDLDVDALLLQFAEALQARHRERHPNGSIRKGKQLDIPSSVPTLRSFIAGDMIFGVGVALLLIVFSIWGISHVIALQSEQDVDVQVEATGPSISEALIGTPVENMESEVTLIPAEDTPIPELAEGTIEIPPQDFTVNVQVNIVAVERTFLRVLVDGEEVFNGRTVPGNAYSYEAEESIEVLVGNGAAVRVIYNQRNLGLLGGFGQVASYIYTIDEIIEPTPVIPPTPTNTPYLSPTPSITPSPTVTPTATEELPVDGVE